MPIRTRRWNDPVEAGDGRRILVTRYRPRGLPRGSETWDEWRSELAPSVALHAAAYGKSGEPPLAFEEYERRYLAEVAHHDALIENLGGSLARGETLTLLCSSACSDPARCHRTVLARLIQEAADRR